METHQNGSTTGRRLRLLNCLSPLIGIEVFELVQQYIEAKLNIETMMYYDPRLTLIGSDARSEADDCFSRNESDLGFLPCPVIRRLQNTSRHFDVLPIAPVYRHPKNISKKAEYFSDVIIHVDNKEKIKEFHDLKGHRWCYNHSESFSGTLLPLYELRKAGFNAHFFGNTLVSGSHIRSIRLVLDGVADAAAVDSVSLALYKKSHPEVADLLVTLTSWGPLPSQPFVANSLLPEKVRRDLMEAFLSMREDEKWRKKFEDLDIIDFDQIDVSKHFILLDKITADAKRLQLNTAYY